MAETNASPDQLSLIMFSGEFSRVHYGLVLAAAALATGRPVTLFFTMGACRALLGPEPDGAPGWHSLSREAGADSPADQDIRLQERGVGSFAELLEACIALKGRFMVCEAGLVALGLPSEALDPAIPVEPGGVVTFLAEASRDGAMLFI